MNKKVGLIVLVVVLALGALGVGYAAWSQSLNVTANVNTGTFGAKFASAVSNDDGTPGNILDPSSAGSWSGGVWDSGTRASTNVGNTTVAITTTTVTGDTLTVTINNAYPGYFGSVAVQVANTGSVPIKVVASGPQTQVNSGGGATTDLAVAVTGSLAAGPVPIAVGASAVGTITIGVGTNGGASSDPPKTGGSYTVTFTVTASQNQ